MTLPRTRSGGRSSTENTASVETALATMSADELREVVRAMLLELDEKAHSRVVNALIQRAARGGSGWKPEALSDAQIVEVLAFAKAAENVGYADPSEVDEYLQRGSSSVPRGLTDWRRSRDRRGAPPIWTHGAGAWSRLGTGRPRLRHARKRPDWSLTTNPRAQSCWTAPLSLMRKAAESRLAGVTDEKRRNYYGHAAALTAVCVACDPSPETAGWVAAMRTKYRRFPALRDELQRALGSS